MGRPRGFDHSQIEVNFPNATVLLLEKVLRLIFGHQSSANLVRAVNRQPGLPRGMTRRAPSHSTPSDNAGPDDPDDANGARKPPNIALTRKTRRKFEHFSNHRVMDENCAYQGNSLKQWNRTNDHTVRQLLF